LRGLARKHPGVEIVIEAFGPHEWMRDVLIEEGARVSVTHPFRREPGERSKKSDARDADRLAHRRLAGMLRDVVVPPLEHRELRAIVRARQDLVERRTSLRNHIHFDVNRNLYRKTSEGWIRLPARPFTQIGRAVVERELPHLASYYRVVDSLDHEINEVEKRMRAWERKDEAMKYLTSVPGVGLVTGLSFRAEIHDPQRFNNAREIGKYLGLDPVWEQSGDRRVDKHTISREGRSYLRGLLTEAAWVHSRLAHDSSLAQAHRRRLDRGVAETVSILALAREIAEALWRCWKDKREFTMTQPARPSPCQPPSDAKTTPLDGT
jgi:transposase